MKKGAPASHRKRPSRVLDQEDRLEQYTVPRRQSSRRRGGSGAGGRGRPGQLSRQGLRDAAEALKPPPDVASAWEESFAALSRASDVIEGE
jgi:hypothetical protein